MEFKAVIESLFQKKRTCPNLAIMHQCVDALKGPHLRYPTVHIAGTNGKGSVAHFIAKALEQSGYKTGLFTSPHMHDFCERIQINFEMIAKEKVLELLEQIKKLEEALCVQLSFFEISTLMAFLYFAEKKVDIAIIETGLGGRYDATNVIVPILSIITSIGRDHEAYLGNTLEKIAQEKAGIIKPGVPVVVGSSCHFDVITQQAEQIIFVPKKPSFRQENQEIAKAALNLLSQKFSLSNQAIHEALQIDIPGRMEVFLLENKPIILDVAHNVSAFERLLSDIPFPSFDLFLSMSKDKNIESCLRLLQPRVDQLYLTQSTNPRSKTIEDLVEICKNCGFEHYQAFPEIKIGLDEAMRGVNPLLITGSFYLISPVRELFNQQQYRGLQRARLGDLYNIKQTTRQAT